MTVNSVLYQNQVDKFPNIQQDYKSVKKSVKEMPKANLGIFGRISQLQQDCFSLEKKIDKKKGLYSLLDVFPTIRRTERVPGKIEKSEYVPAAGLVSLAVLNGPEDMRDVMSSFKQIKSRVQKKEFKTSYDYREAQHPFSFFRGTLLHDVVDPRKSKYPSLVKLILDKDTTLFDSSLGDFVKKAFKLRPVHVETNIERIRDYNDNQKYLYAKKMNTTNVFADLTARALIRTTKLGALALGAIEGVHFLGQVNEGKGILSEAKKSAITYTSSIAGIGYGGAIGAKHFGPAGSIAGMGLGAMLGNRLTYHLNKD